MRCGAFASSLHRPWHQQNKSSGYCVDPTRLIRVKSSRVEYRENLWRQTNRWSSEKSFFFFFFFTSNPNEKKIMIRCCSNELVALNPSIDLLMEWEIGRQLPWNKKIILYFSDKRRRKAHARKSHFFPFLSLFFIVIRLCLDTDVVT